MTRILLTILPLVLAAGLMACLINTTAIGDTPSQQPSNQTYFPYQDQDHWKNVHLRRTQILLERSKREKAVADSLLAQGLISESEWLGRFEALQLAMHEHSLAVSAVQAACRRATIVDAVKWRTPEGKSMVRISLSCKAAVAPDVLEILGTSPEPTESCAYIAIQEKSTVVGVPYERKVCWSQGEGVRSVEFTLLKDLDIATISIDWGDRKQEKEILLQHKVEAGLVVLRCDLFSQEVQLGQDVAYPLTIEHLGSDVVSLRLVVEGLPEGMRAVFHDPVTDAQLSQIRLRSTARLQNVLLRISLPERADPGIVVDEPITFEARAISVGQDEAALHGSEGGGVSAGRTDREPLSGTVALELLPRGTGKMELVCDQLFYETKSGARISIAVGIRNTGTSSLENVVVKWEAPRGWAIEAVPMMIDRLEGGDETSVEIDVHPTAGVAVGDYEVRLVAESYLGQTPIRTPERNLRIQVASQAAFWTSLTLVILLIVLVGATGVLAVRLARRER